MLTRISTALRRTIVRESGQSLIIVALAMTVIAGAGALAIDVSSWYVQRHQDQLVADAAALAAANCLASPNTGPNTATMPQCTSGTDTADAKQVAVAYAHANGLQQVTTSDVSVDTTNKTVSINASANAPAFFANVFKIHSVSTKAGATASWKAGGSTPCTASAQSQGLCYAIYTQNATCGSNNGFVSYSTSDTITGAIHSQGSLNVTNGHFEFLGPITYSSNNCTFPLPNYDIAKGGNYQMPAAGGNQPPSYWPIDYSTVFPACSPTGTYHCTTVNGISGVPSYCTDVSTSSSGLTFTWANADELIADHIYCSIGSGTPSNPATWNGPITFTNGATAGSASNPLPVTFIGGSVTSGSTSPLYLKPAPNTDNCLVYAVDTDSETGGSGYAINFGNSDYQLNGTLFAPNGTVSINSSYTTDAAMFMEAQNVNVSNLSFQGSGPVVSGSGSPSTSSGTDSLTQ